LALLLTRAGDLPVVAVVAAARGLRGALGCAFSVSSSAASTADGMGATLRTEPGVATRVAPPPSARRRGGDATIAGDEMARSRDDVVGAAATGAAGNDRLTGDDDDAPVCSSASDRAGMGRTRAGELPSARSGGALHMRRSGDGAGMRRADVGAAVAVGGGGGAGDDGRATAGEAAGEDTAAAAGEGAADASGDAGSKPVIRPPCTGPRRSSQAKHIPHILLLRPSSGVCGSREPFCAGGQEGRRRRTGGQRAAHRLCGRHALLTLPLALDGHQIRADSLVPAQQSATHPTPNPTAVRTS